VLNVALVVAVACGVLVLVLAVVGVVLWCGKVVKGGGSLVEGGGGSKCEFNLLRNLNIDLRVDTRGYVPVDRVQKD
jgi:hypothetical protein